MIKRTVERRPDSTTYHFSKMNPTEAYLDTLKRMHEHMVRTQQSSTASANGGLGRGLKAGITFFDETPFDSAMK